MKKKAVLKMAYIYIYTHIYIDNNEQYDMLLLKDDCENPSLWKQPKTDGLP